jgi:phosphohistidine phosphatase SixA
MVVEVDYQQMCGRSLNRSSGGSEVQGNKIMNTVALVARHGDYNGQDNLSPSGERQMRQLAEVIAGVAKEQNLTVKLLSSTAARAEQGARIIAKELGLADGQITFDESFWDDESHYGEMSKAIELFDAALADATLVVVLSHMDFTPGIARRACEKLEVDPNFGLLDYGQGWLIGNGVVRYVPK